MTRLIFLTALLIVMIPSLALAESMDDLVKNNSDGLRWSQKIGQVAKVYSAG